jgi:hypothetical protein
MVKKIQIKTLPWNHAEKAKKAGYYVEAIETLYRFIENKLQEIFILHTSIQNGQPIEKIWDLINELSFSSISRVVYSLGEVSESEYKELVRLNSLRNKIIHKMFYEPYEKVFEGISLKNYNVAFRISKKLAKSMENKTHTMLKRRLS